MKKRIAALLCALSLLMLAGCQRPNTPDVSSSQPVSSSVSSEVSSKEEPVSSAASSEAPSSSSAVSEASSEEPESSSAGGHDSQLPSIDVDDPEFLKAFEANPVDASFLSDSEMATTTTQMTMLYSRYAEVWEAQTDTLYKELLELVTGSAREELIRGQEAWVSATPVALEKIRFEVDGAGSTAALAAASRTMEYYRQRAAELSSIRFQLDGNLGIRLNG